MRSLARKGTGYALVTAGTVMLFAPGPGLLTLFGGLALLSEDTEWAARATDWLKRRAGRHTDSPESGT
ncbi:MAG TPA: PGPGW domain-containing protein [Acidimicrobiia bacterium]|nr:PGPGW domain-containing protein [Acidimicrobiia bacterium]